MDAEEAVSRWLWGRFGSAGVHSIPRAVKRVADVSRIGWCQPNHTLTETTFEHESGYAISEVTWEPGQSTISGVFKCDCGDTMEIALDLETLSPVELVREVLNVGVTPPPPDGQTSSLE